MLYDSNRHEPMLEIPWDERLVRDTVDEIVADSVAAFDPARFWPTHPREDGAGLQKGIWNGVAGAIWGLHYLHREAGTPMLPGAADALDRILTLSIAQDTSPYFKASFLMGPVGILLVKYRISREPSDADRLFALIDAKVEAHTDELMWGTPGVVLAASFMWDLTREDRWRDLYLSRARELWARWKFSVDQGCYVWYQRVYQSEPQVYLGPVHGFTGNLAALLRGVDLFDEQMRRELYERAVNAIVKTACTEDDLANWLALAVRFTPPGMAVPWLVQICHGAPGVLGSLADIPDKFDPRFEQLFLAGSELTWRAGPLSKGPNLCHGTAGNGYLLMKAWMRTRDRKWLHRARSFAMYSIAQYKAQRQRYGQGWYTLWTGDIGTAIYLWHCSAGEGAFPTMDVF